MRKYLCLTLLLFAIFGALVSCDKNDSDTVGDVETSDCNTETTLYSKSLTVGDNTISGKLNHATETFNFAQDITLSNSSTWVLSLDVYGMQTVATKTVPLEPGNNCFYIHITESSQNVITYKVNIYRNHIYTVQFNSNGGSSVETQYVEEGTCAKNETTERVGYNFANWDFDLSTPIKENTIVNAVWNANTDTAYTVEYYFENLDKADYELKKTVNLTGTTDEIARAEQAHNEHFTVNTNKSILEGNVAADGSLILCVYYDRNIYNVSLAIQEKIATRVGSVSLPDSCISDSGLLNTAGGNLYGGGDFPYGTSITISASEWQGCTFTGWFADGSSLSNEKEYTFTVDRNIEIEASFTPDIALTNFVFSCNNEGVIIYDVIDKTVGEMVVPDCVTTIAYNTFSGCSNLTRITLGKRVSTFSDLWPPSTTRIVGGAYGGGCSEYHATQFDGINIFDGCNKLCEILVSSDNEAYTSIDGNLYSKDECVLIAYAPAKSETVFIVPSSVLTIATLAFEGCSNLTDIYYTGTEEQWRNIHGYVTSFVPDSATVHYNYISEE